MNSFNFIGYLITGEAADWHISLSKNISEKFNTWKIYEKIPPHITIFQPFDTKDINFIKNFLRNWVKNKGVQGNFVLFDFDRFDDRVIFAKVDADKEIKEAVEELRKEIKKIPNMPEGDFPVWHPHATLINRLPPPEIEKIWNYLKEVEKPNFTLPFDNVTLFKFVGDRKWGIEESFKINQ